MPRLDLAGLGQLQLLHSGSPIEGLRYDKVRALLVFLAVEHERAHRREALAGMFWPDQSEAAARHSLSQALWSLRQAIEREDAEPLLLVSRTTVRLNWTGDVVLDVDDFLSLLDECERHSHRRLESCRACAERLERAVDLYRGGFLQDFALADSLLFEDWAMGRREELRHRAHQAIAVLIDFYYQRGDYERSAGIARRLLALDPWNEPAHRGLMRALAANGQRNAALVQYEWFQQTLAEELGLEPEEGTTALRDRIRDRPGGVPASPVRPARNASLPVSTAPLVGRQPELARIADLLSDRGCQLITLAGPGGIGKTSLAVRAANEAAADFESGACFVPLAGLSSSHLLAPVIAESMSLSISGSEEPSTQLLRYLQDRELLLVLDNFEHLIDERSTSLIGEIVRQAPGVHILVTSRERLKLQGEWVIDLHGLPLPGEVGEENDDGALGLFVQRLRKARWDFALTPETKAAASRICRLVDGVPLGIELAAAWVPVLSVTEIAEEIGQSLDFLSGSARDLPDRHRSMRAVIDSSWAMLQPHEQRTLARLSVFRGGFQRAAAEAVARASLTTLASLVDKSLLRSADGRYELHELLRQYAAEKLGTHANAAEETKRRHAEHFLRLIAHSEPDLRSGNQARTLDVLNGEIENIRSAWRWAVENERSDAVAAATHGLWLFSDMAGSYVETGELLGMAIAAIECRYDGEPNNSRDLAYGRLLCHRGSFCLRTGDVVRGDKLLGRSIDVLSPLDAPADLGLALNFSAMVAHQRGDFQQESISLQESIDEFAAAGDRWGMAYSLNDLGMTNLLLGDPTAAEDLCRRSLDLFVTIGDQRGMAFALRNLGVIGCRVGDFETARKRLRESAATRVSVGHRWGFADSLIQLGVVARMKGEDDEAVACFNQALQVACDIQATDLMTEASGQLGTYEQHQFHGATDGSGPKIRSARAPTKRSPEGAGTRDDTRIPPSC